LALVQPTESFLDSRTVNRRLLQISLVTMLVLAIGGHWALVQSVAWVRMTVAFSKSVPLAAALSMTFDGRHPCALCKVVQTGHDAERDKPVKTPESKLDFLCRDARVTVAPVAFPPPPIGVDERLATRRDPPPIPPPRPA
jgi:hypothetical protein